MKDAFFLKIIPPQKSNGPTLTRGYVVGYKRGKFTSQQAREIYLTTSAGTLPRNKPGNFTSQQAREIYSTKSAGNFGHVSKLTFSLAHLM